MSLILSYCLQRNFKSAEDTFRFVVLPALFLFINVFYWPMINLSSLTLFIGHRKTVLPLKGYGPTVSETLYIMDVACPETALKKLGR